MYYVVSYLQFISKERHAFYYYLQSGESVYAKERLKMFHRVISLIFFFRIWVNLTGLSWVACQLFYSQKQLPLNQKNLWFQFFHEYPRFANPFQLLFLLIRKLPCFKFFPVSIFPRISQTCKQICDIENFVNNREELFSCQSWVKTQA